MGIKSEIAMLHQLTCDVCQNKAPYTYGQVDALLNMAMADGWAWGDVPTLTGQSKIERKQIGWVCQECRKEKGK